MKKNVVVRLLTLSMAAACAITNAPITNVRAAEITEVTAEEVVEAEETAEAEDEVVVYNDADQVFAVGTDGVSYSNIGYLTNDDFAALDADTQAEYVKLCDEYANSDSSSIAFAVDADGALVTKTAFKSSESEATLTPAVITEADLASDDELVVADEDLMENTFDDNMYLTNNFFYNQLKTQEEREIYKRVVAAAKKGKGVCVYPVQNRLFNVDLGNIYTCNAVNAAMAAYPQYFEFVDYNAEKSLQVTYKHIGTRLIGKPKIEFAVSQYWSKDVEKSTQATVKSIVDQAYAEAQRSNPLNIQYEVVKYFDEYLAKNARVSDIEKADATQNYYASRTSYGIFYFNHPMNSEGYAKAMMRLLDAAGIKNTYVHGGVKLGDEMYLDCFNVVEMQDSYYYLVDTYLNDREDPDATQASSQKYLLSGANEGLTRFSSYVIFTPSFGLEGIYSFDACYDLSKNSYTSNNYVDEFHTIFTPKGKNVAFNMTDALASGKTNVTYMSNNTNVFTVKKGKIKGKQVGKSDLTVNVGTAPAQLIPVFVFDFQSITVNGNKSYKETINGSREFKYEFVVNGLTFSENDLEGNSYDVADVYYNTKSNLKVKSSNDDVAVIDDFYLTSDNKIVVMGHTNNKKGSAKITCNFGGKKATVSVKVNN